MNELKQLKTVLPKLNSIPNINCGGCGVVALHIYNRLVAMGKKPKIFTVGYDYDPELREAINNREAGRHVNNRHVVVKYGRFLIDSNGVHASKWHLSITGSLVQTPVDLLQKWVGYRPMWNPMFDRQQIPVIKNIIWGTNNQLNLWKQ